MIKKLTWMLIGGLILLFVLVCGTAFIFVFSVASIFYTFGVTSERTVWIITFVISSIIILGIMALFVLYFLDKLPNKFNTLVKENLSIILTAIIFLILFLMSLKNEVYMTQSKAESVLPVLWGIFGISVSIFVLWHTILEKSISNNNQEKTTTSRKNYAQILEKQERRVKLKDSIVNIMYFIVNVVALCLSSGSIYLAKTEIGLLEQCLLLFTFYVSTNTLITVLNNIVITPAIRNLYNQIKDNKVSQNELDKAKREATIEQILYKALDEIIDNKFKKGESPQIDEQQKEMIINDIICKMQDDTKNELIN